MKKLIISLLCVLVFAVGCNISAFADSSGSGNMSGGGGGMGSGSSANFWNNGDDGIRVTVVRVSGNDPVSTPIDLTNKNESDVYRSFSKASKLQYKVGASLEGNLGTYTYKNPSKAMPTIITGNGNGNIEAIKSYFCSEETVQKLAELTGISYSSLTSGDYKLLLEPIAYFTF